MERTIEIIVCDQCDKNEAQFKCGLCGKDLCEKCSYEYVPSNKDSGIRDDYSYLKSIRFCMFHFGTDGGFYPKKGI